MGVDSEGRKHVLGLWPGATENGEVCGALLDDLIERGCPGIIRICLSWMEPKPFAK